MDYDVGITGMRPPNWVHEHYHEFAVKINPVLRAALDGELQVSEQKAITEAWLGLALFQHREPVPLEEVIGSADSLNHDIPTPEEVAWAFTRLKLRGWLNVDGGMYGLSSEGRRAIDTIMSQGNLDRLNNWILENPPSKQMTAMDVFLTLGRHKGNEKRKHPSQADLA